jgi:hypothetical protein
MQENQPNHPRRISWPMQYIQDSISQFKLERSLAHAMVIAASEPSFDLHKHRRSLRRKGVLVFLARKDYIRVSKIMNGLKNKHA